MIGRFGVVFILLDWCCFSDVVRKLSGRARLTDFIGVLSPESGDRLEKVVKEGRKASIARSKQLMKDIK